ncbi:hypothetical protein IWX49DRAFT_147817 [Phyllosticta citricarpa]|uniref:Uncharacterized protein n=1 Tax=Phyllosticta citricarpa TaxID=55181 RepID=A0ABR1MBI7_9PEZI
MAASVEISRPMRKATCPLTPPQLLNHDKLAKKGEPPSSHTRHKPSIFTRQRLELCPLQPVDLLISSLFLIRRQFWFKRYPISERQEDGHPILRGMWEQLLWIRIIFFFFFFFHSASLLFSPSNGVNKGRRTIRTAITGCAHGPNSFLLDGDEFGN